MFVDDGLVEDGGRISRTLLLGILVQLQRRGEIAFAVEKPAASEEARVLLVRLPLLLQLALEFEVELELRDERLLGAIRKQLVVPIDLRLRLGKPPRAREQH